MTLQELARRSVDLHVYSKDTEDTILRVARLFEERSGVTQLEDIGPESLLKFKTITLSGAKEVTFNGYLGHLKALGSFAEEEKIVKENPFKKQRAAPKTIAPPKVVDQGTFRNAFWYLARNPIEFKPSWFWKSVMKTIYYTGIRRRQLVTIKLKDLDFESGTLRASAEGSKTRREWLIPLHPKAERVFKNLIMMSELATGRELRPNDYLFVIRRFNKRYAINSANPEQMQREQITGFFKRLSGKIDARIGAHRLRHTTATKLCNPNEGGADISVTQDLLGHVQLATTRMYVHTNLDNMREAVNNLPEIESF